MFKIRGGSRLRTCTKIPTQVGKGRMRQLKDEFEPGPPLLMTGSTNATNLNPGISNSTGGHVGV